MSNSYWHQKRKVFAAIEAFETVAMDVKENNISTNLFSSVHPQRFWKDKNLLLLLYEDVATS